MNCLTQLYNVDSLVTDKGTINLDDRIAGQLFIRASDDAQILVYRPDNVLDGLLTLRERHAFSLYGTAKTLRVLDANPVFEVLVRGKSLLYTWLAPKEFELWQTPQWSHTTLM